MMLWHISTCLILLLSNREVLANTAADIVAGREALSRQAELPWYDPGKDALQRVEVQPLSDDTDRKSDWASTLENQDGAKSADRQGGSLFWDLMQALAWTVLAVLLVGLVGLLIFATWRWKTGGTRQTAPSVGPAAVDRMEELPLPVPTNESDLLTAARRSAEAGDYNAAIKFLFSHELLELDKHRCIELTRGKTNRQYLRELQFHPQLERLFRKTMFPFEKAYFGQHPLQREAFLSCWNDLPQFRQILGQLT